MHLTPQTQGNDLLARVGSVGRRSHLDDTLLAPLAREAKQLCKVDAFRANIALGLISALEYKPDAMREHFKIALNISSDPLAIVNQAVAEQWCGNTKIAAEIANDVAKKHPDDIDILQRAAFSYAQAGEFLKAESFILLKEKLKAGHDGDDEFLEAANLVRNLGESEEKISRSVQKTADLVRRGRIRLRGTQLQVLNGESITLNYIIDSTPQNCAELTRSCDLMFIEDNEPLKGRLLVGFIPSD